MYKSRCFSMCIDRRLLVIPSSSSGELWLLNGIGIVKIAGIHVEIYRIGDWVYFDKYDIPMRSDRSDEEYSMERFHCISVYIHRTRMV